jgi:hypothetical protein
VKMIIVSLFGNLRKTTPAMMSNKIPEVD